MRKFIKPAIILLLCVVTGALFHAIATPPIDPATPWKQNGFRLLHVYTEAGQENAARAFIRRVPVIGSFLAGRQRPKYAGLLIDAPHWPNAQYMDGSRTAWFSIWNNQVLGFTCTGLSSTGVEHTFASEYILDGDDQPILMVVLPPALPGNYRWLDVTVRDQAGGSATWRITGFHRARHNLKPPVQAVERIKIADTVVEGRAWYDNTLGGIAVELMTPYDWKAKESWQVSIENVTREWQPESVHLGTLWGGYPLGKTWKTSRRKGWQLDGRGLDDNPAPRGDRYVRIQGHLIRRDTYRETVRFPPFFAIRTGKNGHVRLDHPITRTTPSGIRITIETNGRAALEYGTDWNGPEEYGVDLPGSPLYRKYRQPINVEIVPSWTAASGLYFDGPILLFNRGTPDRHRIDLTFSITHSIDTRRLPISLAVPVQAAPPPGYRAGSPVYPDIRIPLSGWQGPC